ncbi:hypothetical protein Tco_0318770 [Tanacetum coccineum]
MVVVVMMVMVMMWVHVVVDGGGGNGDDGCSGYDVVGVDEGSLSTHEAMYPRGARTWRSSTEGGDSEMSGDGGGGGKARSLSTSSSDGKGIGASGRIDILAVVRYADGDGGVAADSSVSNGSISLKEETMDQQPGCKQQLSARS